MRQEKKIRDKDLQGKTDLEESTKQPKFPANVQEVKVDEKPAVVIDENILRFMKLGSPEFARKRDFSTFKRLSQRGESVLEAKITEKSQVSMKYLEGRIIHELEMVRSLRHRNILDYTIGIESTYKVYLIAKVCENGTLEDFIARYGYIDELVSKTILEGCLSALKYLHLYCGIAHRNIAPANVFLDDLFLPKIGNFELAKSRSQCGVVERARGSHHYSAPETWRKHDPFLADVWALGAVFFEMLVGRPLVHNAIIHTSFDDVKHTSMKDRLSRTVSQIYASMPLYPQVSDASRELLDAMIQRPCLRPTAKELLQMLSVPRRIRTTLDE